MVIFPPASCPISCVWSFAAFLPSEDVVTSNLCSANHTVTTNVDRSYPFCEPSNRSNTTLDFYHLMLTATCSPNKEQASSIFQRNLRNRTSYDWSSGQLHHPDFRASSFSREASKDV